MTTVFDYYYGPDAERARASVLPLWMAEDVVADLDGRGIVGTGHPPSTHEQAIFLQSGLIRRRVPGLG
ncbi:hypothetical protein AB0I72_02520 [Nocardiopsis sp. NPDC049922]|uniref:hypothetical protein n=1 Tax=Nocardiopsis sp. NPDC049922 TaxID=3155157 RepID=UPI0033FB21FF